MHNRALAIGNILTQLIDLRGRRKLLDVGGGPGTLSALFAQQNPELAAAVAPAIVFTL